MLNINAIRVIGSNIEVDIEGFNAVLGSLENGIIATSKSGFISKNYQYQVSYLGYVFFYQSTKSLQLPNRFTLVVAKKIYSPLTVLG